MNIEGLHNQTGKWITLVEDLGESDYDAASEQILAMARAPNSVMIIWGQPVVTDHFSSLRLSKD